MQSWYYYIVHGLFVTIMVTTKRPHACILIDNWLGVIIRYCTAFLDVHYIVTIEHLTHVLRTYGLLITITVTIIFRRNNIIQTCYYNEYLWRMCMWTFIWMYAICLYITIENNWNSYSHDNYYIVHGLFVTIMVTTKRLYVCILLDSLLGVRYIETGIHIHTACLK